MKIVLSWLRELVAVDASAEDLAELLTSKGVKVEDVTRPWEGLRGVIVARVLEKRPHPNSDRLTLARLDTGSGEARVAAGVANWEVGDLIPYAPPGSRVPVLSEPLGVKELRGETSEGMMCSPRELALSTDHGGILVLPSDAPIGADLIGYLGLDDAVLDVEIEPNRPDLMSVIGVAREVSAATGVPLVPRAIALTETDRPASDLASVEVLDVERCPRYLARVIAGVTAGPAPLHVQARMTAAGMRPVSNVVDATNYAMLELGQPMHPFDLDRLEGRAIVVRRARDGERLVTLDEVERILTPEDLVIADRERAVAIAGVMGGAMAEVSASTTDVLLESAYFARFGVLFASRRLNLSTEASMRFERGADPEAVGGAADRAAALITEWSGGEVLAGAIDVGAAPARRSVRMHTPRMRSLLGMDIPDDEAIASFGRLGMSATVPGDGAVDVEIPGYRVDLLREVDLIEEVVRIHGYEDVPSTVPAIRQAGGLQPSYAHRRRVRIALVRAGLRETTSSSFASQADLDLFGHDDAIRLAQPLSAEEPFLRTSLLPSLLRTLRANLYRQVRGAWLFEVGRVFRQGEGRWGIAVDERDAVAFALTGRIGIGTDVARSEADFFDAKGALETLMAALGIADWSLGEPASAPLHPARSAAVLVGGHAAGIVAELDPTVAAAMDFADRVALAELDSGVLAEHATIDVAFLDVPRLPPLRRDLAFVVDAAVPAGAVRGGIVDAGDGLVDDVVLFDVFTGPPLPQGTKSLAFSLDLRAPDRTLAGEEADAVVAKIVAHLAERFGAQLRSG